MNDGSELRQLLGRVLTALPRHLEEVSDLTLVDIAEGLEQALGADLAELARLMTPTLIMFGAFPARSKAFLHPNGASVEYVARVHDVLVVAGEVPRSELWRLRAPGSPELDVHLRSLGTLSTPQVGDVLEALAAHLPGHPCSSPS